MKVSLFLGLILGFLLSTVSPTLRVKALQENDSVKPKPGNLEVSLAADKRRYKRREGISLEVKLTNTDGVKDLFVYGTLEFGYRGSLRLYRRNAKGKEVPTRFIDEALTVPPETNNQSAFVKLLPDHFLGTSYNSTIYLLNLEKPGR